MTDEPRRRVGVYPGTFNPVTIAHLAIADAAVRQERLDHLDLVLSTEPIDKHGRDDLAPLDERIGTLELALGARPWARVTTSPHRLIAELARGYDVVVLGADKWAQVGDASYYDGDTQRRDEALAALPRCVVAPRAGFSVPEGMRLDVPEWVGEVSATAVRSGRREWHGLGGT